MSAQQPAPAKDPQAAAAKPEQKPDPKPDQPPDQPKYEETVVVSASRTEEKLINAPATMTVIGPETIQSAPTQNFAELLRTVPGVNITQVSARDINVTSRGATGTLSTGTLALLDGRSLYQDFFGFVMWDFLPVNLNEIKQVEVIRGPASAVWGANALNGVVNVITKSPREMQGTSAVLGVGGFDRPCRPRATPAVRAGPARSSTSAARTRRRSTIAWRSSCRRRLHAGSLRASDGQHSLRPRRGLRHRAQGLSRRTPTRGRRSRSSTRAWTTTIRTAGS